MAKAIADQLRAKLTGQEQEVLAAKPTDNPQAYDVYLRGLVYTLKPQSDPHRARCAKYLRKPSAWIRSSPSAGAVILVTRVATSH